MPDDIQHVQTVFTPDEIHILHHYVVLGMSYRQLLNDQVSPVSIHATRLALLGLQTHNGEEIKAFSDKMAQLLSFVK